MKMGWVNGSEISVKASDKEVTISANREGLLSLAQQLRTLAEADPEDHIHYDDYSFLEEGSSELVIELL